MSLRAEIIWAFLIIIIALLAFYLGILKGATETEESMRQTYKEQTEEIKILENKVQQLSEELISRGIYSYPQANLILKEDNYNSIVLITLNGKEPVPHLEIESNSILGFGVDGDQLYEKVPGFKTSLQSLNAHNPVAFEIGRFNEGLRIDLIFKSGSNRWQQYIYARKTSKGEIKTFWVITNRESEVIDKHLDNGYPTDPDGDLYLGSNKKLKFSEIKMYSLFPSK